MAARTVVELDGDSLEIDDVIKISEGECYVKVHVLMLGLSFSGMHACFYMYLHILRMFLCIQLSEEAEKKVKKSRNVVDDVVKDGTGRLIASPASGSGQTLLSFNSSVWGSLRLAQIYKYISHWGECEQAPHLWCKWEIVYMYRWYVHIPYIHSTQFVCDAIFPNCILR